MAFVTNPLLQVEDSNMLALTNIFWSVIQDSNLWPLGPKPSAIPGFANHR